MDDSVAVRARCSVAANTCPDDLSSEQFLEYCHREWIVLPPVWTLPPLNEPDYFVPFDGCRCFVPDVDPGSISSASCCCYDALFGWIICLSEQRRNQLKLYYERQAIMLDQDMCGVDRSADRPASVFDDPCVVMHPVLKSTHSIEPREQYVDCSGRCRSLTHRMCPSPAQQCFCPLHKLL